MQRGRGDPRGEVQRVGGSLWTGDRIDRGLAQGGPLGEGAALLRCQQSRRGEGRGYGGTRAAIWNSVTSPWGTADANPRPDRLGDDRNGEFSFQVPALPRSFSWIRRWHRIAICTAGGGRVAICDQDCDAMLALRDRPRPLGAACPPPCAFVTARIQGNFVRKTRCLTAVLAIPWRPRCMRATHSGQTRKMVRELLLEEGVTGNELYGAGIGH